MYSTVLHNCDRFRNPWVRMVGGFQHATSTSTSAQPPPTSNHQKTCSPHQSPRATQATPTKRSIRPFPHHSSRKLPRSARNRCLLIELRLDHQQTFFADRATSRLQKHKVAAESQLRPAVLILLPGSLSILHFSRPAIDSQN